MKLVTYCTHCGGTTVLQDAYLYVNTGEYNTYDNMVCGDCSYDGNNFEQAEVDDDFEPGTKINLKELSDE